jgi:enamine deaminase RidA (YjgF/YER057c/UK114 family)
MKGTGSLQLIRRTGHLELHLQLIPEINETAAGFAGRIAEILRAHKAKVLRATFFGRLAEQENTLSKIGDSLDEIDFPHTWIEGNNCNGTFINGVYIIAVSGLEVGRLRENCFLGGLCSDPGLPAAEQAETVLASADRILKQAGLNYGDTIRTWFYLDDILSWYGDFNRARSSFYRRQGIFDRLVPASTGIGGQNERGSRVCMELTAIKPRNKGFSIERVVSPMQCSAEDYGSAFSRAVKVSDSEYETMTVSGTASINPEGKTVHAGDLWNQIELSCSVVEAILESQGFSFGDVVRSYAYCSDKSYSGTFHKYMETRMPVKFACILAQNDICRDDLMFEVEVDVIKKKIHPQSK